MKPLESIACGQEIRSNRVTFPAQVPVFVKHDRPDLQRKLVQLYFLSGWSTYRIATRYSMTAQRVHQVINTWKQRAVQMGYIQEIPHPHSAGKTGGSFTDSGFLHPGP